MAYDHTAKTSGFGPNGRSGRLNLLAARHHDSGFPSSFSGDSRSEDRIAGLAGLAAYTAAAYAMPGTPLQHTALPPDLD